jgi:hypothetical protein
MLRDDEMTEPKRSHSRGGGRPIVAKPSWSDLATARQRNRDAVDMLLAYFGYASPAKPNLAENGRRVAAAIENERLQELARLGECPVA